MPDKSHLFIATRGSALALAQANMILARCRAAFPELGFDLKIIKTTGDKLQTASLAQESKTLPKGLFTKELEVALLDGTADLAVHSLKDLPTDLPTGLKLGAVGGKREDVRDVLIYRDASYLQSTKRGFHGGTRVKDLPAGTVVASSSTRRRAQLLRVNPGVKVPDIRGNVATRMQKVADNPELDATILALAGIHRLHFTISSDGSIQGENVPPGLLATVLETDEMLPCVGQGAIGIEVRADDAQLDRICASLNDAHTLACVIAERAFLSAMGGGCQSPVAAHAEVSGDALRMQVLSFTDGPARQAAGKRTLTEAVQLGQELAAKVKHP
jgi:hydroxymethylbilane synthase